jgi:hypothetical protein
MESNENNNIVSISITIAAAAAIPVFSKENQLKETTYFNKEKR